MFHRLVKTGIRLMRLQNVSAYFLEFFLGVRAFLPLRNSASISRKNFDSRTTLCAKREDTQTADWAVIFDCDGVILESEGLHREAYNRVIEKIPLAPSPPPNSISFRLSSTLRLMQIGQKNTTTTFRIV